MTDPVARTRCSSQALMPGAAHPFHVDGSFCSAPDLSGFTFPAPPVEDALRDEVERLRLVVDSYTQSSNPGEKS